MTKQQINVLAPNFELNDIDGNSKISLSDYRDKKNVLIVFNRGFMWPFCKKHMTQLRDEKEILERLDIEVLIIGPEKPESFRKYWKKESLPFVGLPDPKHLVANLYGQQIKIFKLGRMPAQMLINKKGILIYSFYGNSMSDIPSLSEVTDVIE